jgi:hypothetical protein
VEDGDVGWPFEASFQLVRAACTNVDQIERVRRPVWDTVPKVVGQGLVFFRRLGRNVVLRAVEAGYASMVVSGFGRGVDFRRGECSRANLTAC